MAQPVLGFTQSRLRTTLSGWRGRLPHRTKGRRRALARNLAATLARAPWLQTALEMALRKRLPSTTHKLAAVLAEDLIAAFPKIYAPAPEAIADEIADSPAFETIFRFCQRHRIWPQEDLTPPTMRPTPAFRTAPLPDLPTEAALADWLLITPAQLAWFADLQGRAAAADDMPLNHYFPCLLAKPKGGHRLIEAPKPALKALQRRILTGILNHVPPHTAAHGFTQGRSCITAAAIHASEEMVLRFDIQDFFPRVPAPRIHALFRCLGYPHAVARALTGLVTTTTHPNFLARVAPEMRQFLAHAHLPQGAPTSPALANLAAFNLDRRLSGLARRLGASYTRYADDLAFSGDTEIARPLRSAVPKTLVAEGFAVNPAKTRSMPQSGRQSLTGLTVNAHVNLPRREYDRIKAAIHQIKDVTDPAKIARLEGRIQWAETASPARGQRLRARFDAWLAAPA